MLTYVLPELLLDLPIALLLGHGNVVVVDIIMLVVVRMKSLVEMVGYRHEKEKPVMTEQMVMIQMDVMIVVRLLPMVCVEV